VYNATFSRIKIPGTDDVIIPSDIQLLASQNTLFSSSHKCYDASLQSECPCNTWMKFKQPDKQKSIDLILVAHRGIWGGALGNGAPENSKSSIEATVGISPIIEVDVMFTKNKKLVLTHDYALNRLSNYSGSDYWFNVKYYKNSGFFWWLGDYESYKLKKRNGTISPKDKYLLFSDMLSILKKKQLVALIDIKSLMPKRDHTGECILNCEYDPATPEGQDKILDSWVSIFKECYKVAEKRNLLHYIAFKLSCSYDDLKEKSGLNDKQLSKVLFLPMKRANADEQKLNDAINFIDTWIEKAGKGLIAIESNFNLLSDLIPFTRNGSNYQNLLQYISLKGYRPGVFSEEPVGAKGVVNRWADWFMKDLTKDTRGDHLSLISVPYFQTAVVTTDRQDVWQQIANSYNSVSSLSAISDEPESGITKTDELSLNKSSTITAVYKSGFILVNGLEKADIGSNIIVHDLQGHVIHTDKIDVEPQMVIAKKLQAGVYILKISGNRYVSVKIIANH
jgi:glycerophosphoryl diester phosphodiesterase